MKTTSKTSTQGYTSPINQYIVKTPLSTQIHEQSSSDRWFKSPKKSDKAISLAGLLYSHQKNKTLLKDTFRDKNLSYQVASHPVMTPQAKLQQKNGQILREYHYKSDIQSEQMPIIKNRDLQKQALIGQIKKLSAELFHIKNEKYGLQNNPSMANIQTIKGLNLKLSIKSTLIQKIQKSIVQFKKKISRENLRITPQCYCQMQQIQHLIQTHENNYLVKEGQFHPLQKDNNKIVIVYRQEGKSTENWKYKWEESERLINQLSYTVQGLNKKIVDLNTEHFSSEYPSTNKELFRSEQNYTGKIYRSEIKFSTQANHQKKSYQNNSQQFMIQQRPKKIQNYSQQVKNGENTQVIQQMTRQMKIYEQQIQNAKNESISLKEAVEKYKHKIQTLQQKLISNGLQLHTMDLLKQKLAKTQQLVQRLQNSKAERENNPQTVQSQEGKQKIKKQLQEKQAIIQQLSLQKNQSESKLKQIIAQMENLKIEKFKIKKQSSYELIHHDDEVSIIESDKHFSGKKTNIGESQHFNFGDQEQQIKLLKKQIQQKDFNIKMLHEAIQVTKIEDKTKNNYNKLIEDYKALINKYQELKQQHNNLLATINKSKSSEVENIHLKKIVKQLENQNISLKEQIRRLEVIIQEIEQTHIHSYSENNVQQKQFYRYKADQRYLQLKRKLHEIYQTYAHGTSPISFLKKYENEDQVPQKHIILQMIQQALRIMNKFEQTIIIKKSQLKKFNQNKLFELAQAINKLRQNNQQLKEWVYKKVQQQESWSKIQIDKLDQ